MRNTILLCLALVLFLIPVVLTVMDEPTSAKLLMLCQFGGLASFVAAHLP